MSFLGMTTGGVGHKLAAGTLELFAALSGVGDDI
jgi:hypothetical protein